MTIKHALRLQTSVHPLLSRTSACNTFGRLKGGRTKTTGSFESFVAFAGEYTSSVRPMLVSVRAFDHSEIGILQSSSSTTGTKKAPVLCSSTSAAVGFRLDVFVKLGNCWRQAAPKVVALCVPVHGSFATGSRKRRSPTLHAYVS